MQALGGHRDIEDTGTTYRVGCPMYCFREYTWQLLQGWEVSGQRPARAPVCVCVCECTSVLCSHGCKVGTWGRFAQKVG